MRNQAGVPARGSLVSSQGVRTRFGRGNGPGWAYVAKAARRGGGRALSVMLVLSLLASSTPAAPPVLTEMTAGWGAGLAIWWQTSSLASGLKQLLANRGAPTPRAQEKQTERDSRVSHIRISPGNLSITLGEQVHFAAIALDQQDDPVGGVRFTWGAHHAEQGRSMGMSRAGAFVPRVAGTYRVTVSGAGRQAQATVVVRPDAPPRGGGGQSRRGNNADSPGGNAFSTRALPRASSSTPKARTGKRRVARAGGRGDSVFMNASLTKPGKAAPAAPAVFLDDYDWDDNNYWAADDPGNTRGDPPGGPADGGAGSGNFQLLSPVLGLPGRGLNLSLSLVYNSRVWNKANSQLSFDIDRDWPAPGWTLGFGKMMRLGDQGSLLVDADGTRHAARGNKSAGSFVGHTTDGTFIDYSSLNNSAGTLIQGEARMPNGTKIQYGAKSHNAIYPTLITDANGNCLTITYRNGAGPHLETIYDTLGRTIRFHYDSNNLLTAVTAPDIVSGERTLIRLHYRQLTLEYNFSGTAQVRDGSPWVVDAIYYPATGTGYWFGDGDSYSTYGMIAKVSERRGMTFSASSLEEQGTVTSAGSVTRQETYDYPLTATSVLNDAPTYGKMTDTWEGMDTAAAETIYIVDENATPRRVEVRQPNGTRSIQLSYNFTSLPDSHPDKYKDGLVYQDETRDSDNNLLHASSVTWEQGAHDSPRPSRVEATNYEIGKKTATTFEYGPFNQVVNASTYDYADIGATPSVLLKTASTTYENGANYTAASRHIYNLPKKVEIFAADGARVSLTEYQYDGSALLPTPDVTQHDYAYDPFAPEYLVTECAQWDNDQINCLQWNEYWRTDYRPETNYRGNVTQVTTYTDAAADPAAGAITETRTFDVTGNMVTASSPCRQLANPSLSCEQTSYAYTLATQYAYATSMTRGAPEAGSPARITTGATFDFNTGLALTSTDPDQRTSQTIYDPTTLRPREEILSTGGRTTVEYDDALMKVTQTTLLSGGGAVAAKSVSYMNGMGLVKREESLAAPEASSWGESVLDVVETKYDELGRIWQQTSPYRSGSEQPQWMTNSYDALGRVWKVDAPDGSVSRAFFNDLDPAHPRPDVAGAAPGETMLVVDAWGRERWGRTDAQGRMVEVVEPDPDGGGSVTTGGLLTTYSYDTLGNLTDVVQGAQHRRFAFDSLGRLLRQKLAERDAVFDGAGLYVGPGGTGASWSDLFAYDIRSNLVSRTDPRNVKTTFSYQDAQGNPDPLNRLLKVEYAVQTGAVPAADSVTYQYVTAGDLTNVEKVTTKDPGTGEVRTTEEYRYDVEGRVDQRTVKLASRADFSLVTNYTYDNLGRVTDLIYPRQYPSLTRKTVHHDFDVSSRLSGLAVDGEAYASQLDYNASSQMTSLKVGVAGARQVTEKYVYDPTTGLLTEQRAYRGVDENANRLLHLSYDYLRPGTTSGRTGQLTKITDRLNPEKGRSFGYDALGRLKHVGGGDPSLASLWTQDYSYDRYGNRKTVTASGTTASLRAPADPSVRTPDVELAANTLPKAAGLPRENAGRAVTDAPNAPLLSAAAAKSLAPAAYAPGTPSGLQVTASSTTGVSLSWSPPAGGADHYEVERGQSRAGQFTFVGAVAGNAATYSDTSVDPGEAYLYRVRAVDSGGSRSAPSNMALGATFAFTDVPIVAGVTPVRAQHFTELRQAVDVVRGVAGLPGANWTDADLTPQATRIRAVHLQELRDRLTEALAALQISTSPFTDPALSTGAGGTPVKKLHVDELRQRAARGQSSGSGGPSSAPVTRDGFDTLSFDVATNRIDTAGWEYDAAGNQTRVQVSAGGAWRRYEYDALNRLVAVKTDGGAVVAGYAYGHTNARLVSHEGATRIYYAWDAVGVVAEYAETDGTASAASPQWGKNYIYLDGRLLATQQPAQNGERVEYHHPDRLGTRVVSNNSDQTYFEQTSLPFGTAFSAETTGASTRRFTSYDRSVTTGLDYANNRFYDSQQGRFTQVDPMEMGAVSLDDPQTLNLYTYCGNDPVNNVDPDGLLFGWLGKFFRFAKKLLKWALVVVAVIAAVAIIAATMGAGEFAAFLLFKIVAPMLSNIALIAGVPGGNRGVFGPGGTAPTFPGSSGVGALGARGFGWQDSGTCPPGYTCTVVDPVPVDGGTVIAKRGWWERGFWRKLGIGLEGFANEVTFGLPNWIHRTMGHMSPAEEEWLKQQDEYKGGEGAGIAAGIFLPGPGKLKVVKAGKWFRRNIAGVIPANKQNMTRGLQLFGGRIRIMKHYAHAAVHTQQHYQIELARKGKRAFFKIRRVVGTSWWKWTRGSF